jgi:hypothetical protein
MAVQSLSAQCLTPDWTIGVRFPAEATDFSSSLCVQASSEAHPASCPMGTAGTFCGGKARPRRDADYSPPSSAEVKNDRELYPPLAPALRKLDSFFFYFYNLFIHVVPYINKNKSVSNVKIVFMLTVNLQSLLKGLRFSNNETKIVIHSTVDAGVRNDSKYDARVK